MAQKSQPPAINPSQRQPSPSVVRTEVTTFQGPLPDPNMLRAYDQAMPGLAERLVTAFEAEGAHRRMIEQRLLTEEALQNRRHHHEAVMGQACGLLVALSAIAAALWLGLHGQPWAGAVLAALGIGSIVYAFIKGRGQSV